MKLRPNSSIFPEVGFSKPRSMDRVVVLPAPFPPSKAVIVPFFNSKHKASTARTLANFLVKSWARRTTVIENSKGKGDMGRRARGFGNRLEQKLQSLVMLASRSWANSVASSRSLPSKMSSKQRDLCVAITLEKGKGTTNLSQEFSFAAQPNSNDRKRIGALAKRATKELPISLRSEALSTRPA